MSESTVHETTRTPRVDHRAAPAMENAEKERETPREPLIESELLVEDVSIDGMCGVY